MQLTGGTESDFSLRPSGGFQAAAGKWNEVALRNRHSGSPGPQAIMGKAHANAAGQRMGSATASPITGGWTATDGDLKMPGVPLPAPSPGGPGGFPRGGMPVNPFEGL